MLFRSDIPERFSIPFLNTYMGAVKQQKSLASKRTLKKLENNSLFGKGVARFNKF